LNGKKKMAIVLLLPFDVTKEQADAAKEWEQLERTLSLTYAPANL
jgi:hypothetical protein